MGEGKDGNLPVFVTWNKKKNKPQSQEEASN
jgi:hypothetical protein